jgi:two-component system, OmpR family, response regulator VicR
MLGSTGGEAMMHRGSETHSQIVIVDDEVELLQLLKDILEDEGHDVIAISDPTQVQPTVAGEQPYLFFLDLMLPGIDGIELASRLRAGPFRDTPIIAMSASSAMLSAAKKSDLFQATLAKPFELSTMLGYVARYIA